jgi:16S rRNA (guanine527-N7)-methyltransferase
MPEPGPADLHAALTGVLADAVRLGTLGVDDLHAVIEHSRAFATVLRPCRRLLDLGSGAGVPGLVLAVDLPGEVVLLEASRRRADALQRGVVRLGLGARVSVVCRRAEELGREPTWRGSLDAVVARSFGPPALVAEAAAPLLRVGGQLVVSDPPDPDPHRWPAAGLAELGLRQEELETRRFASFTQVALCPERFPRHARRPLF